MAASRKKSLAADPRLKLIPPAAFESMGETDRDPADSQGWMAASEVWDTAVRGGVSSAAGGRENQRLGEVGSLGRREKPDTGPAPDKCLENLLGRQGAEIVDLRQQIKEISSSYGKKVQDLEQQLAIGETRNRDFVSSLKDEIEQKRVVVLGQQKDIEDMGATVWRYEKELEEVRCQHKTEESRLRQTLRQMEDFVEKTKGEMRVEIENKDAVVENLNKQVNQLKTYIGQSESCQTEELWKKEKQTLENELKASEEERERLSSMVQLLNVRLSSLDQIQSLQDQKLMSSSNITQEKKQDGHLSLLKLWREKVFSLLVQKKLADITTKKEKQEWMSDISELSNKLDLASNEKQVLSHSLSDKQAEVGIQLNNNKKILKSLFDAEQNASILNQELEKNTEFVKKCAEFVVSMYSNFQEFFKTMKSVNSKLQMYSQRIDFACSRMLILQGQFSKCECLFKFQVRQSEGNHLVSPVPSQAEQETEHLVTELELVRKERDALANQGKVVQELIESNKLVYEEKIFCQEEKQLELEKLVKEKAEKCTALTLMLENTQVNLAKSKEIIEGLQAELEKTSENMEKALKEQNDVLFAEYIEQMADLEHKLNEVQAEYTKVVLSLNQLERQNNHEKKSANERMQVMEDHYNRQIEKLQEHLKTSESERNLMMATLRQEGVLAQLKAERLQAASWNLDSSLDSSHTQVNMNQNYEEPLSSVIEDLRILSATAIDDDSIEES